MNQFARKLSFAFVTASLTLPNIGASQTSDQERAFTKEIVAFTADDRSAVVKSKHGELYKPVLGKPGTWPGIVLVHGLLGVTASIRLEAEALASHGYLVLVVNLYEDVDTTSGENAQKRWMALDRRSALTTCEGALSFLQSWSMDPKIWVPSVGEKEVAWCSTWLPRNEHSRPSSTSEEPQSFHPKSFTV